LVVLARTGEELEVEFTVFDANLDAYLAVYQFVDRSGRAIGEPLSFQLEQPIRQSGMLQGQSFSVIKRFKGSSVLSQVHKVNVTLYDREGSDTVLSSEIGKSIGRIVNVSAASYLESGLASEAITSAFGSSLTDSTQVATTPVLPTKLGQTRVFVRDSANVERLAPLFFAGPTQINYQIPAGTAAGPATITVAYQDEAVATSISQITPSAPSLFAANSNGQGVAAAQALRVKSNGTYAYESVAVFDQANSRFLTRPIALGSEGEQVYLVLFGTGIRHRSALTNVKATIGDIEIPVDYAGPQSGFVGLDQVNVKLPRTLTGRGEVDVLLTVDGKSSNVVKLNIN